MSNFQNIDQEEIEQDQLILDVNLLQSQMTAANTNITNIFSQTSGVGTSGLKALTQTNATNITTNTSSINTLTSTVNTHETEINALQSSPGLFGDMTFIIMNTPEYYDMSGTFGAVTGSKITGGAELATDERRFVIGSLGIVQDTVSTNDFSFSESDTKITFGWSSNNVLVFYRMEHYDNSIGNRTLTFGMYDDYNNNIKFSVRHDIYMESSSFRFKQVSGFAGSIAIQSNANYYFYAKSSGGGNLQGLQFFLIKANKNF